MAYFSFAKLRKLILAKNFYLKVIQFDLPAITKYFVKWVIYQKPNQRIGKHLLAMFKDTHRGKTTSNKTPAQTKSTNMGIWVVGTSNQLFKKGS